MTLALFLGACAMPAPVSGPAATPRPVAPTPEGSPSDDAPVGPFPWQGGPCDSLPAGNLKVSVVDTQGRPVSDVDVRVQPAAAPSPMPSAANARALTCAKPHTGGTLRTNAAGAVTFGPLQPGDYVVSLVGAGPKGELNLTIEDDRTSAVSLVAPTSTP